MKILSIYSPSCCLRSVWLTLFCGTQKKIFWRMSVTQTVWFQLTSMVWTKMQCMSVGMKWFGCQHSSKYLHIAKPYRFRMAWGQVHDNIIFGVNCIFKPSTAFKNIYNNSVEVKQLCVQWCVLLNAILTLNKFYSEQCWLFGTLFMCRKQNKMMNHELTFWQIDAHIVLYDNKVFRIHNK